ncbi:MAG: DMT family transporter [Planctomycetota bacterium]|jgi:drug/metabolite transporter (DMT)-like permease|nr:DMT family transporter [Planctomycetota bacterium]
MTLLMQAAEPPFRGAGEFSALGGALVWAIASILYAKSFRKGGTNDAVWFKNFISTVVLGAIALAIGREYGGGLPAVHEFGWILLSGLFGMWIGDWMYFIALTHLGVSRSVILTMATPALTAILAWWIFGEVLVAGQWLGILCVVSGSILVESRRLEQEATASTGTASEEAASPSIPLRSTKLGYLACLTATLSWTVSNLMIRMGIEETGAVTGGALRLAAGTFGFAIWFLFRGQLRQQMRKLGTLDSWRKFAFPTFLGTVVGMSLYVAGFKWAPQGVASSLASTVPLFALPLSIWLLKERSSWRGWIGSCVVVIGVFLVGKVL